MTIEINLDLLKAFEEKLDPARPEDSPIPARVLGYGEISTVFEIHHESQADIAFKRMPLFDTQEQIDKYKDVYFRYHDRLKQIGIELPEYGATAVTTDDDRSVLYLYQRKLPSESIGDKVIQTASEHEIKALIKTILHQLLKVWEFNAREKPSVEVAIDGQVSNWAVKDSASIMESLQEGVDLVYLDTSTPLFRENEVEQLDVELFLRPTPPGVRYILKKFYLDDIVNRYYDFRKVIIDLVANFFKEQRPELVSVLIEVANDFLSSEARALNIIPITYEEVEDYYKDDASTWKLYLRMRRLHRFIRRKLLRRYYAYILPGEIQR
ncbi:MAG: hypothetical protein AM326_03805 [Candidatus Thorarchaeota archaeon SMTZ-45]|nr:MAG: hypothetical protein AM326_03805 [Candidatus Thorarchaeota archaeon SMTZ-45]